MRVPTVMVRDGTLLGDGSQPSVVVTCPADVWDHTFGLHGDQCLIVRPDKLAPIPEQHEYMIDLAELTGKRDLVADLQKRFGPTPDSKAH